MIVTFIIFFVTAYVLYELIWPKKPKNFPPGPGGYPIIGAVPTVLKLHPQITVAFRRLGELYGPVTGIYLGRRRCVILNNYEVIKEVLTRDEFLGRPFVISAYNEKLHKQLGVMFATGELWKNQRRFTLRTLRDWGFGKTSLESVIHDEIDDCFQGLRKRLDSIPSKEIFIHDLFGVSVVNILWAVMAGKRFCYDDEKFKHILEKINTFFRSGNQLGGPVNDWPILTKLPYFKAQFEKNTEGPRRVVAQFLQETIAEHMKTRKPDQPRDFIDEYLQVMDSGKDREGADTQSFFFLEQLVGICMDLLSAGAESSSNTVAFNMMYMILYPEVQAKVQAEIDDALGKDSLPSYEDRFKVPYTEAVFEEVQRLSTIAPLTPPHATTVDTTLQGYNIPKDTIVMVNLTSINMDPNIWENPTEFKPERHLTSDGKFKRNEHMIAFGIGKRACPGESLARMTTFIFSVAALQRFHFSPIDVKPTTDPLPGFTLAPTPFSAKVTLR